MRSGTVGQTGQIRSTELLGPELHLAAQGVITYGEQREVNVTNRSEAESGVTEQRTPT